MPTVIDGSGQERAQSNRDVVNACRHPGRHAEQLQALLARGEHAKVDGARAARHRETVHVQADGERAKQRSTVNLKVNMPDGEHAAGLAGREHRIRERPRHAGHTPERGRIDASALSGSRHTRVSLRAGSPRGALRARRSLGAGWARWPGHAPGQSGVARAARVRGVEDAALVVHASADRRRRGTHRGVRAAGCRQYQPRKRDYHGGSETQSFHAGPAFTGLGVFRCRP